MDLAELQVFLTVASERSFSKAAARLHRTQPAVSQAIRRLEDHLGERLFDRAAKDGKLTEAGRVLLDYAQRLMRLAEEADSAVRELRDLQRGRVLVGANEAAVHVVLPVVDQFRAAHPRVQVDIRRVPSRQIGVEVLQRSLDVGVLSFPPAEKGLASVLIGDDELVMLTSPGHPLATRAQVTMAEFGRQNVIAHNEASPARERVLRLFEQRHEQLNITLALPSLDGIKRAVEMDLGVALLPRRCAIAEITSGRLCAVPVAQVRLPRHLRLVYPEQAQLSHAANAFIDIARKFEKDVTTEIVPADPRDGD
ncbi:MAG TPA: LysR family transcriptional regulator [Luteitalea sp.]|nr:LysR family transcriptional regulator [Luteitalea sp.]